MIRAVKEGCLAIPWRRIRRFCHSFPIYGGGLTALTLIVVLAGIRGTAEAISPPMAVQFQSCPGWGLCVFRRVEAGKTGSAARSSSPATLRVRLRGVGDPALQGECTPEREAARTVRRFVEGILTRADRIELDAIEPRTDGSVLATVRVDGTDVADIVIHIGLGREKPLAPGAAWCE